MATSNDLNISQAGYVVFDGISSFSGRTFQAGAGITITNADGTAGNTTIGLTGGDTAIDSIAVQTGISPVIPNASGQVTINGAVVSAGTNPIRTDGTGASTLAVEVQISQAIASADATKIGLCNFDSSSFSVAATGFVTASTTGLLKTLTGNSGGAISPTANNINTVGSGSITIAGSGSTLTTQLTGLTNHSVQVGAGTATLTQLAVGTNGQVLIGATAADPAFATLTSSDSSITFTTGANSLGLTVTGGTTVGKTITGDTGGALSPTAGNWNLLGSGSITTSGSGSTLTTQLTGLTNHAVLVGAGTSTMTKLAVGTNGQVLIGSTGADPAFATITSTGGTIAFTLGANSLNMEVASGGFTWSDVSGAFSPLKQNGYFVTGTATGTLPASPTQGDTIQFVVDHASQVLTIDAPGTQIIRFGSLVTAAGGTAVSTAQGDSCELVYRAADTCWFAVDIVGNWTLT